jgi:hypothetical protein
MAESDRRRLLERALALPTASPDDFFGGRQPPSDADPQYLRIINDTALRTRLIDARVAEGLQSPKGPQRIASIIRVYPEFDAPGPKNGRPSTNGTSSTSAPQTRGLPTVEDLEALLARIRELEREVSAEIGAGIDAEIERLKTAVATSSGAELEDAYRDLGSALERKRSLGSQIRFEAFRRIERDTDFAPRAYLRLIAR